MGCLSLDQRVDHLRVRLLSMKLLEHPRIAHQGISKPRNGRLLLVSHADADSSLAKILPAGRLDESYSINSRFVQCSAAVVDRRICIIDDIYPRMSQLERQVVSTLRLQRRYFSCYPIPINKMSSSPSLAQCCINGVTWEGSPEGQVCFDISAYTLREPSAHPLLLQSDP